MNPGLSNPTRAPFITLEGGEGAGKSTLLRMLTRRVKALGLVVVDTREPGATALGANIRRLVSQPAAEPISPWAELLLFMADRAEHVEKLIRPALNAGKVVICDRFADSSEVYQGRARGLGWERVRDLNQRACQGIWPDLTLVLDLDPSEGLDRARERQGTLGLDRLENEDLAFHHAVRAGFLAQQEVEPGRMKLLDAAQPQEKVATQAWKLVEPLVKTWKNHAA